MPGKLLEIIIHKRLVIHLYCYNLYHNIQRGFTSGVSTSMAILSVILVTTCNSKYYNGKYTDIPRYLNL